MAAVTRPPATLDVRIDEQGATRTSTAADLCGLTEQQLPSVPRPAGTAA